jgi:CheY-like chemotaxis protein
MKTILFADDNVSIRKYCRAALEDEGYRVLTARDGMEALDAFRGENPDLAVLDISMPRMGGLEALEQIKGLAPDTAVILFTAHDEACLGDSRAALAAACIEKSEDLRELKRTIASTLAPLTPAARGMPRRLGLPPPATTMGCS